MAQTTGAKFFADTLKAYGVTHVFVAPSVAARGLAELSQLGVKSIVTHGEKAAAYMADGYARAANRPGVCLAQSVGAANMAAGLQDAYLALSPVIAMTGRKTPMEQYKNAYQEIEHSKPFASVTKFSGLVETVEQFPAHASPSLPRGNLGRHRSGTPGPAGHDGQLHYERRG